MEGYDGGAGQTLRARARDDVQIAVVNFVIAAEDGALIPNSKAQTSNLKFQWPMVNR